MWRDWLSLLWMLGVLETAVDLTQGGSAPYAPLIITKVSRFSTRHSRHRQRGYTWGTRNNRNRKHVAFPATSPPITQSHRFVVEVGSLLAADDGGRSENLPVDTSAFGTDMSDSKSRVWSTSHISSGSRQHNRGMEAASQTLWEDPKLTDEDEDSDLEDVNRSESHHRRRGKGHGSHHSKTGQPHEWPTSNARPSGVRDDDTYQPFINDPECPRKPDAILNRKCFKKCHSDDDCRGRNKRCLCDDVCGRSCVKQSKRCQSLKALLNGNYEIVPFNTFAARVRYRCNPGFVLSGHPERVCQGDGYWSAEAPTCETQDTAPALLGKCANPPIVQFAKHDKPPAQTVFPLGIQLTYSCADGYTMDGFFRAMCVGEGRWVGPRMTCSPRRCPHPGDIPNGRREGNSYIYPNRVTYTCAEGYELQGNYTRQCLSSGDWSGTQPICKPVTCPPLNVPANGDMTGKEFLYGAVVRFSCFRGFQLHGSNTRECQQDGIWSGIETTCATVDCGFPGPFYDGFLKGQLTTFGARIEFKCFGRTRMEGPANETTCLSNGEWSAPLPKCWRQCEIPGIVNGSVRTVSDNSDPYRPGMYVDHGHNLTYKCSHGYALNSTEHPGCLNGTWSFIPVCKPAPCTNGPPPNDIRDGLVRFHSTRHGDKAKYRCNPGFQLIGDEFLMCDRGKWTGSVPYCEPVYCDYPGTIENGQILLVGAIGKYEYRHYVRRIGHNEKIEFRCHKGYKRMGPMAATCVDGDWSPKVKPYCVLGQHPKMLYIFRGKRDAGEGGDTDVRNCSGGAFRKTCNENLGKSSGGEFGEQYGFLHNGSMVSHQQMGILHTPGSKHAHNYHINDDWDVQLPKVKPRNNHRRKPHYRKHRHEDPVAGAGVEHRLEARGKVEDRRRQHRRDGELTPWRGYHG